LCRLNEYNFLELNQRWTNSPIHVILKKKTLRLITIRKIIMCY